MAAPDIAHRLTEAEYLALERAAEFKSEFYDGEMFAMAGGTAMHSLIATNIAGEVREKLKGGLCKAFTSDLRLKVETTGLFTYPDVSVVCGPLQFVPGTDDTVMNPTVIFEVLSDSTEAYDRGEKFQHYRQMPSLQEYVIVSQRLPRIEHFLRGRDGEWTIRTAEGKDASIGLPSLKIALELNEVFAGVEFTPSTTRPQSKPV
jgi:Uma2 family endonuclease